MFIYIKDNEIFSISKLKNQEVYTLYMSRSVCFKYLIILIYEYITATFKQRNCKISFELQQEEK